MAFQKVEGEKLISYDLTHRKSGPSYQFRAKIKDGAAPYIRKRFSDYNQGLAWAREQLTGAPPQLRTDFIIAFEEFIKDDHKKRLRVIASSDDYKERRKVAGVEKRTADKRHWAKRLTRDLVVTDMTSAKFVPEVNKVVTSLKHETLGKLKGKDLSPSSKKNIMIVVVQVLRYAFERGYIHHNPKYNLDNYADPELTVPTLTIPMVRSLMQDTVIFDGLENHRTATHALEEYGNPRLASIALEKDRHWCERWLDASRVQMNSYWALTALMIYTGMRPVECNDLKWSDVDMVGMVVGVESAKGMKDRNVPIMAEFLPLLEIMRKATGHTAHVLPEKIRRQHPGSRSNCWKGWARKHVDLPSSARLYSCRHTHAALLVAMAVSDLECMLRMGHKEKLTTLHYANQAMAYREWVRGWGEEFQLLKTA